MTSFRILFPAYYIPPRPCAGHPFSPGFLHQRYCYLGTIRNGPRSFIPWRSIQKAGRGNPSSTCLLGSLATIFSLLVPIEANPYM